MRARVSGGCWRLGQSAREGGAARNEAGVSAGHWQGSKKGARHVGKRRCREIRRRARVHTRRSTAGAGRADLTGQAHGAEREKGTRWATTQQLANRAREAEREDKCTGEETGADRLALLGSERESGRACGREGCR
jgi:hypothetical protein